MKIATSLKGLWAEIAPMPGEPVLSKPHWDRIEASIRRRYEETTGPDDISFDEFLSFFKSMLFFSFWCALAGLLWWVGFVAVSVAPGPQWLSRQSPPGTFFGLLLVAVLVTYMIRHKLAAYLTTTKIIVGLFCLEQFIVWFQFLFVGRGKSQPFKITQHVWTSPSSIASATSAIVIAFVLAIVVIASDRSKGWALAATLNVLALLVGVFSNLYWHSGTPDNWSIPGTGNESHIFLSRWDALLVALGNFTTAGTFGITPLSELARKLVIFQLGLDVAVGILLVGLLIARLTRDKRGAANPFAARSSDME